MTARGTDAAETPSDCRCGCLEDPSIRMLTKKLIATVFLSRESLSSNGTSAIRGDLRILLDLVEEELPKIALSLARCCRRVLAEYDWRVQK